MGMCCMTQVTQTGALQQTKGWDEEGGQVGGEMGVPMADSC